MISRSLVFVCCLCQSLSAGEAALTWCWSGGVTDTQAVVVGAAGAGERIGLRLRASGATTTSDVPAVVADADGVVRFTATGLAPATSYAYAFVRDGNELAGGSFTSMPPAGRPADFTIAFGACCAKADSPVFNAIAALKPLLFLNTGDLHYDDIGVDEPARFREAIARQLLSPTQSPLYRSLGIAYVWDDHDYGPNNSRHDNKARPAAHAVYRQLVPHHPLALTAESPQRAAPIAQAFTIGRVRFVLTDLRSEHSREPGSLMGERQRTWFLDELTRASQTHALVVWVSSVPWISTQGNDNWAGGVAERRLIANHVKAQRIPLCILSGDAHMVAIDDGRNADYADGGGAPIPVFQAASLDRAPSYKGGPYSHGARPGVRQFGVMQITDDGTVVRVAWSARDGEDPSGQRVLTATKDGDQPIAYTFTVGSKP